MGFVGDADLDDGGPAAEAVGDLQDAIFGVGILAGGQPFQPDALLPIGENQGFEVVHDPQLAGADGRRDDNGQGIPVFVAVADHFMHHAH